MKLMWWKHNDDKASRLHEEEGKTATVRDEFYQGIVESQRTRNGLDLMVKLSLETLEGSKK